MKFLLLDSQNNRCLEIPKFYIRCASSPSNVGTTSALHVTLILLILLSNQAGRLQPPYIIARSSHSFVSDFRFLFSSSAIFLAFLSFSYLFLPCLYHLISTLIHYYAKEAFLLNTTSTAFEDTFLRPLPFVTIRQDSWF